MTRTPPLEERIDPSRTALLVIDMQNDFVHDDGATASWMRERFREEGKELPAGPSLTQRMVPRLQRLIAHAREAGVPVIWVKMELDESTRDRFTRAEGWLNCERGTWGAEWYDGLGPVGGERVVPKHRHSAFFGTDLAAYLHERGIQGVVVTGTATQGCVEAAVRDANAHDFWAVVVGDCSGQMDEVAHAIALERMNRVFGMKADSDEVIQVWRSRRTGASADGELVQSAR